MMKSKVLQALFDDEPVIERTVMVEVRSHVITFIFGLWIVLSPPDSLTAPIYVRLTEWLPELLIGALFTLIGLAGLLSIEFGNRYVRRAVLWPQMFGWIWFAVSGIRSVPESPGNVLFGGMACWCAWAIIKLGTSRDKLGT